MNKAWRAHHSFIRYFLLIGLLCFSLVNLYSQRRPSQTRPYSLAAPSHYSNRIDSLLSSCQASGLFNGVGLVVDEGKVIFRKAYGYTNPDTLHLLQPDDVFCIASITKQFTAFLILRMQEEGLLNIYDPITQYLKEFASPAYEKVTIYHLLTHTSGLPNYTALPDFDQAVDYSEEEMFLLMKKPLQFEAGSKYDYSNSGYFLLGKILERVSGLSFADLLDKEVFAPLQMTRSSVKDTWPETGIAQGYWRTIDGMAPMPGYSCKTLFSTGGIFSTVDDLLKWEQALYDETFLSKELREIMFTPYKNDYGCGWYVRKGYHNDGSYYERHLHGGMIKGYHCFIFRRIPQKQTIILFDNNHNQEIQEIKNSIWRILEDGPTLIPQPKLSNLLFQASSENHLLVVIDSIRSSPNSFREVYEFEEYDINTVGYRLMEAERYEEAEAVMKFNIHLFPEAWNVYDSIGELYFARGLWEEGKEMYEKSLELNPMNGSAREALEMVREKDGE